MAKADPTLLRNWGDAKEVSGIVGVLASLQLQRCPAREKKIPTPKWEEEQLSLRSDAVALTISRKLSAPRSFNALKDVEATSRDGLVRVVLEVDPVQPPRGVYGPTAF